MRKTYVYIRSVDHVLICITLLLTLYVIWHIVKLLYVVLIIVTQNTNISLMQFGLPFANCHTYRGLTFQRLENLILLKGL